MAKLFSLHLSNNHLKSRKRTYVDVITLSWYVFGSLHRKKNPELNENGSKKCSSNLIKKFVANVKSFSLIIVYVIANTVFDNYHLSFLNLIAIFNATIDFGILFLLFFFHLKIDFCFKLSNTDSNLNSMENEIVQNECCSEWKMILITKYSFSFISMVQRMFASSVVYWITKEGNLSRITNPIVCSMERASAYELWLFSEYSGFIRPVDLIWFSNFEMIQTPNYACWKCFAYQKYAKHFYTMMKWNFSRLLKRISEFAAREFAYECEWWRKWERERRNERKADFVCVRRWMHLHIHLLISNDKDLWYEAYFNDVFSLFSNLNVCIQNMYHEIDGMNAFRIPAEHRKVVTSSQKHLFQSNFFSTLSARQDTTFDWLQFLLLLLSFDDRLYWILLALIRFLYLWHRPNYLSEA